MAGVPPNPASQPDGSRRPTRRLTPLFSAVVLVVVVLPAVVATAPQSAQASTPELLLDRPRVGEFQPVRGDNFIAWQQNTRRNPDHYDVFATAVDSSTAFRVNPRRVNGANGDIDGDLLVYQEFRFPMSRLRLFDLTARDHRDLPSQANSPHWEYWPSISGDLVLFGRLYDNGVRRIILLDRSANTSQRLDSSRVGGAFVDLAPGQVNGDWAVWHKCRAREECHVILYHIPDGDKTRIPGRAARQYSAAVASDGTVFYARSRGGCGSGTRLVSRTLDGQAVVMTTLPSGVEVSAMDAHTDAQGMTTVLFDQYECGRAASSGAWQIEEDVTPQLTVKVAGDGTVTSSPPGISCGADCTETYELGTGVTLTAEPAVSATFAGWSGACTGSSPTCTLEMNGPRSVTATFTGKPVLTVTKGGTGTGTVTSSPAGINCGTDCSEPYNEGTSVTLTSTPAAGSTFAGWSGACGGSALTCTVTMNISKEVVATFTAGSVLTVSVLGSGSVTGPQISCPGDCIGTYVTGTDVTLTATAAAGWSFGGWTGCDSRRGRECTVDMTTDKSVTATFVAAVTLTVSLAGDGSGTVAGSGIACPGDCTGTYESGTDVILTANAAAGSSFASWTGCDSPSGNQCTMDMTTNKSVTATFTLDA